jgi:hypothetical protein
MKAKTQKFKIKLGIFYLQKKSLLFILSFFLFTNSFSQQNISDVNIQEKVAFQKKDSIQSEREKGSIYISNGTILYSENNIYNVELIKTSTAKNKTVYSKTISKKFSKKNFKEKSYKVKNITYTKVNFNYKSNNDFNFLSSIKNEVITSINFTTNFIFKNSEQVIRLNNYRPKKTKIFYKSSNPHGTYFSHTYVRPPPALI